MGIPRAFLICRLQLIAYYETINGGPELIWVYIYFFLPTYKSVYIEMPCRYTYESSAASL